MGWGEAHKPAELDAAKRMELRRAATRGGVDPDYPAARTETVARRELVGTMAEACALLGIEHPATVRAITIQHQGPAVELVIIRRTSTGNRIDRHFLQDEEPIDG